MKKNRGQPRAGFTLVEIMIVVAIIGLLAAIAIPNFVKARQTAQTNACINNLRVIDSAKQQWALEQKKIGTDIPLDTEIALYFGHVGSSMPVEPVGGVYNILAVNTAPTCSKTNALFHNATLPF
ncbi:MAG: type II secretion system protein [Limisphaerales bacterium]